MDMITLYLTVYLQDIQNNGYMDYSFCKDPPRVSLHPLYAASRYLQLDHNPEAQEYSQFFRAAQSLHRSYAESPIKDASDYNACLFD